MFPAVEKIFVRFLGTHRQSSEPLSSEKATLKLVFCDPNTNTMASAEPLPAQQKSTQKSTASAKGNPY
jgi:hypothetical protein